MGILVLKVALTLQSIKATIKVICIIAQESLFFKQIRHILPPLFIFGICALN